MNLSKQKLTDELVKSIDHPEGQSRVVCDSEVVGFRLHLSACKGYKYFVYDWRQDGRSRRVNIGSASMFTVDQARAVALEMALNVAKMRAQQKFEKEFNKPARGERTNKAIEQMAA